MSFPAVFYLLGWIMSFFGAALLLPGVVSYMYEDAQASAFLDAGTGALFFGVLAILMNRQKQLKLTHKDAFLLTFLVWVSASFVGALPFYFSGTTASFVDAVFESVSGLTTTGASVLSGLDTMDHGILLWRSMLQWLGGMGIVVFAIAVLPFLGVGGLQLYRSEMAGVVEDKLQPRLKETAKMLWLVYFVITLACILAYWVAGMSLFDAICHAFSTVATGGYSTHDASIGYFNSPVIEAVCVVFMLLGSTSFALHYAVLSGKHPRIYLKSPETRFFAGVILLVAVLITAVLVVSGTYDVVLGVRYALFNTVSVITTTGFGVVDYNLWPVFAPMILLAIMFIGGCTGSTSGGMKVLRVMMIMKQGNREFQRLLHPKGIVHVKIGRQKVPDQIMQAVWSFAGLYILSFIVLSMALSAFGIDLVTAFSAVAASITSVGPGLGDVGPAANYAHLPQAVKLILAFAMLLGRLELFTMLIIFMPSFWRK